MLEKMPALSVSSVRRENILVAVLQEDALLVPQKLVSAMCQRNDDLSTTSIRDSGCCSLVPLSVGRFPSRPTMMEYHPYSSFQH